LTLHPLGPQAACAFGANHNRLTATTQAASDFMGWSQFTLVLVKFVASGANSLGF
jgi:hypothetical protein